MNAATTVIEVHDAEVRLGQRTLWSHAQLTLRAGQFMALLGPNGVGKTTLVRAVLGLVPLSAGSIELLGHEPGVENSRVGYLPQRRALDPSLRVSGWDLVSLGLDGDRWGIPLPGSERFTARGRERAARVNSVIETVGATGFARRGIGRLSGGEQQRLLIAQALVREPALLLLDEPLEGLDLSSQAATVALLARICREHGIAVLMVAHDVNPLLPYLDLVAYVGDGSIVSGTPESVINSATLSRLYHTDIEVVRRADGRLAVLGQPEMHAHCAGDTVDCHGDDGD